MCSLHHIVVTHCHAFIWLPSHGHDKSNYGHNYYGIWKSGVPLVDRIRNHQDGHAYNSGFCVKIMSSRSTDQQSLSVLTFSISIIRSCINTVIIYYYSNNIIILYNIIIYIIIILYSTKNTRLILNFET